MDEQFQTWQDKGNERNKGYLSAEIEICWIDWHAWVCDFEDAK